MPYDELTRVLINLRAGQTPEKHICVSRQEMSEEDLRRVVMERETLLRGMREGGPRFLDGMEKLFGDMDPSLKEQIDRARRMGR